MPEYDYACLKCGRAVTQRHKMEELPESCPYCGGMLERCWSKFEGRVQFIGSGFHCNDYGKGKPSKT